MAASLPGDADMAEPNVYWFADELTASDPIYEYTDDIHEGRVPLVIDNGSFKCRVGWAIDEEPRLIFKNVIAKQRGKKDCEIQIGNDISNIEVVRWQLKTQFDRNVVTHYDVQENVYDYIFSHLGINSAECVDHPIVLTEPVCNPNYCRQQMSELLFECYHVPSVAYGMDSLFSFHHNHPQPVCSKVSLYQCRPPTPRLTSSAKAPIILQLYPAPADSLVVSCGYGTIHVMPILGGRFQSESARRINMGGLQVDTFMQRLLQLKYPAHFSAVSLSRAEELVRKHCHLAVNYQTDLYSWAEEDYYMDNVHIMQLPHVPLPVTVTANPDQQKERREQQIKRLKDINTKRREEKLAADQEKLQQLLGLLEIADDDEDDESYMRALTELGYTDTMELQIAINRLNNAINKLNNKILMEDAETPVESPSATRKRGKEDKKQKSLLQQFGDLKDKDLDSWLLDIKRQRTDLLETRTVRKQKRADMARRRTFASQQRMKIITELAQGHKRKKNKEDTFGANDDDWNVYKQINKDGGDSDSEAEQEKLEEYETILREYDPNFKDGSSQQPSSPLDLKEYYRIYVGVERIRIPELIFQPSMMGMDQAGVADVINFVLNKFTDEEQMRLAQHVFVTGGCAMFENFKERLERELLEQRPFQSQFNVHTAQNPVLDAWYGARSWALSPHLSEDSVTRRDYEEKGGEYLKEHAASNQYFPTPSGGTSGNGGGPTSGASSSRDCETPVDLSIQMEAGKPLPADLMLMEEIIMTTT